MHTLDHIPWVIKANNGVENRKMYELLRQQYSQHICICNKFGTKIEYIMELFLLSLFIRKEIFLHFTSCQYYVQSHTECPSLVSLSICNYFFILNQNIYGRYCISVIRISLVHQNIYYNLIIHLIVSYLFV